MQYAYDPMLGSAYARQYANYSGIPENQRLFFYDVNGSDCTNFCCQCVWAAYGGWIPGIDSKTMAENKENIKMSVRMAPSVWYGSLFFSGSNKWCRVVEFHDYALIYKTFGPNAYQVFEGSWQELKPPVIQEGDVIQMVVASYAPYRYGHCLYVTQRGASFNDIKICCHSYDRLDAPLSEFSSFPDQYTKLRLMRFKAASFIK